MDLRTGKTYATREEALNDGVPVSDLVEVVPGDAYYANNARRLQREARAANPRLRFSKGSFKRINARPVKA